jgi:large subunit ribosomal protein L6
MSRIGKKPITLPKGVSVTVGEQELEVKGPKGTLKTPIPAGINFKLEGEELRAERTSDDDAALHGLARALANNAVVGVTQGFSKQMDVVGVGYKADVQERKFSFHLAIHIQSSFLCRLKLMQKLNVSRRREAFSNTRRR